MNVVERRGLGHVPHRLQRVTARDAGEKCPDERDGHQKGCSTSYKERTTMLEGPPLNLESPRLDPGRPLFNLTDNWGHKRLIKQHSGQSGLPERIAF